MARSKSVDEAAAFVRSVARHNGWQVNRDRAFLSDIVQGLSSNYNRYGYFLCPCRDGEGDRVGLVAEAVHPVGRDAGEVRAAAAHR